jgi:anti-sigma regulatory factor (Ser/Thr protein kinase)
MAVNAPAVPVDAGENPDLQRRLASQWEGTGRAANLARRFPRDPSSVGSARRAVDELADRLQPDLLADLRLLVSELMANSVEHAPHRNGEAIRLSVSISDDRVRAAVQDGGRGFTPLASRPAVDAPSGRGLYFVDQLATSWGVTSVDGTCVWFELERSPAPA